MTLLIQIAQFVFIISVLVILHELGHFLPAKYFKTKVEKFYLFFDYKFSLFKKKIGDTEYGIGWIPFGGYVKIAGMIDESMDREQLKKPAQPWEFRSKPAWQRLIIMMGGVLVNFFLAWFIYSAMLLYYGDNYIDNSKLKNGVYVGEIGEKLGIKTGDKIISIDGKVVKVFDKVPISILLGDEMTVNRNGENITFPLKDEIKKLVLDLEGKNFIIPAFPPIIGDVVDGSPAQKATIQKGDEIIRINDKPTFSWSDLVKGIKESRKDTMRVLVNRKDKLINLNVFMSDSIMGVKGSEDLTKKYFKENFENHDKYSFVTSIPKGFEKTISSVTDQVRSFKLVFNKKTKGYTKVKGPIGIVTVMAPTWNWHFVWRFMAMFSVWLAFLNLLPIPALDGGHIVFLLYEMISGRAPSQKVMEYAQIAGFIIVMTLMFLVIGNDIYRAIFGA